MDLRAVGVDPLDIPVVRVDHGVLIWDPETCPHHHEMLTYVVSDDLGNDRKVGTFCMLCGAWMTFVEEGQPALPMRILSLVKQRNKLEGSYWGYKNKESA